MSPLVSRRVSGEEWPGPPTAEAAPDWSIYLTLERTQWLEPEAIQAGQLRQVRRLLAHCVEHVPHYREGLRAARIAPADIRTMADFRRLPILPRRTYRDEGTRMHASVLPRGTRPTAVLHTSGSSGMPVAVPQTDVVSHWWWGCYLRDIDWCGIDPRGRLAVIRSIPETEPRRERFMRGVSLPRWDDRLHTLVETGPCHVMDLRADPADQLDWLSALDPTAILSLGSNLRLLALTAATRPRRLASLQVIQSYAETLEDTVRAYIESVFRVPVRNSYSCREAGYLASPCPDAHGLHVHAENVILEVLHDDGRPCGPGETGRVILTTLHNFRGPLVRYDILDEATAGPARCACGRGLPTLTRVDGRRRPLFRLPDGRLKTSGAIGRVLRDLEGVQQFQVVQRAPDDILVRIVPGPDWRDELVERITAGFRRDMEAPVRVQIVTVARLESTRGGKVLDFISELDGEGPGVGELPTPAVGVTEVRAGARPPAARPDATAPGVVPRRLAGNEWPPVPSSTAAQVWSTYLLLDRSQWLTPAELEAGQLVQLRRLLRHCAEHVPYYRELFASIGFEPGDVTSWAEFRRLPLLDRATVARRPEALHADRLPPGTRQTEPASTSGTSGIPVVALQTNVVDLWWLACPLRDAAWCGVDFRARLAMIRATGASGPDLERALAGLTLPSWGRTLARVVETGPGHLMDIHQDPRRQLEWLAAVTPDYLVSAPSNVACLADLARDEGVRLPSLRAIQVITEELTDDARASIEGAFSVPVWNTYTCSESGFVASPCPDGHGLHVHSENVVVEVIDATGQPCPPGTTGRVVLTTLHNFLMPFVRYDIKDEAEVGPAPCPCGRGLPLLRRVLGKLRPAVPLPGGRMTNSSTLLMALTKLDGVRQFQVVQRDVDRFIVRVVPSRAWTPGHAAQVAAIARAQLDPRVRVEVVSLERIERPPGGKLRAFISELDASVARPGRA